MLNDTGTGATLLREDVHVWRDILEGGGCGYHLKDLIQWLQQMGNN